MNEFSEECKILGLDLKKKHAIMDAKSQFRFSKAEYSKSNLNMVVITS